MFEANVNVFGVAMKIGFSKQKGGLILHMTEKSEDE